MLGTRHRTKVARGIVTDLIVIVAELRADDRFSPTAPELTDYLRHRHTRDLVNAAEGTAGLQQEMGPMSLLRPEVLADVTAALHAELQRRAAAA